MTVASYLLNGTQESGQEQNPLLKDRLLNARNDPKTASLDCMLQGWKY
jgi:hypothetical protein